MKNFIIIGTQRTGSSAISESIGLHKMIACGWEWTLRVPRSKKFLIAEKALNGDFCMLRKSHQDHINGVYNKDKSMLGFRWLFSSSSRWIFQPRYSPALWLDRLEDFTQWVSKRFDIYIIHIVRQDSLDWLKSIYIARKAKSYSKEKYPDGIRVVIPIKEAIRRLRAKNWVDLRLNSLKHSNPFFRINYEDFLENQEAVVAKGIQFLNCTPNLGQTAKPRLKKQSKGNVSDYIINYNELLEELSNQNLLHSDISHDNDYNINF